MFKQFYGALYVKWGQVVTALVLVTLLAACEGVEVTPADISGQPIVGHWYLSESVQEGDNLFVQRVYMHVREDGYVLYANLLCRQIMSSGARNHSRLILEYFPIKRINVKKMVLQKYPLTPKYEISLGMWPDQGEGVFEVDSLPLGSIGEDQVPEYRSWECQ